MQHTLTKAARSLLLACTLGLAAHGAQAMFLFKTIDWLDLIPEEDLRLLETIPEVDHAGFGDDGFEDTPATGLRPSEQFSAQMEQQLSQQMTSAIEAAASGQPDSSGERTWRDALVSDRVRSEFNNSPVRLPGYVVPLAYNDKQQVTEFFLVPYFGACIHVPPPPPNQIIHVSYPSGFDLPDLYTPFWVQGTLKIATTDHELGISAYSLANTSLSEYTEEDEANQ